MKHDFSTIKKFGRFYKPHKKLFMIDMICAFFVAFIDLSYPMLAKYALNDLLPRNELRGYFIFVSILLGLYLLRVGFQFVNDYWGHILGIRIEYDLRKELFIHLQRLSFRFYDKTRVGHIMSRMINDLNEMTEMAHHVPEDVFLSAIMLIGSFFAMLFLNWQLALGVYAIVPIMVFFAVIRRKKMSQGFKKVKEKISGVNAQLESSISGIRVSKAFANEEHEISKFNESNTRFKNSKNDAYMQM
uniref:ABC transporter ATP-binding protein n=1 Tax=Ilyobacter sp. TaxID=3100343 RepID=UPI00356254B7